MIYLINHYSVVINIQKITPNTRTIIKNFSQKKTKRRKVYTKYVVSLWWKSNKRLFKFEFSIQFAVELVTVSIIIGMIVDAKRETCNFVSLYWTTNEKKLLNFELNCRNPSLQNSSEVTAAFLSLFSKIHSNKIGIERRKMIWIFLSGQIKFYCLKIRFHLNKTHTARKFSTFKMTNWKCTKKN